MFFRKAWAFFRRDAQEALSYKGQLALDLAGIFMNVFIFFYIAKYLAGGDYFRFVLPGIALAGFQAAALEGFSKAIAREQGAGTLEAILLSPTSLQTVILFNLFWTSVFAVIKLAAYLLAGFLFFHLPVSQINLPSAALTLLLTTTSLSGLGMISAGFVLLFKRGDPVAYAFNGLSRLLSGVYFPVAVLPPLVQKLGWLMPLTSGLGAFRKSLFEGIRVWDLRTEFGSLLFFSVILIPAGLSFFNYALETTKKEGTLSTY